ncbi:MAG: phospholipid carrier-dependent glycosyltransferase, partial [Anaerolineales bacterium]|nr:phospholipid carrier-dependent glycosyltransferase [Anaerolineales bacterium]
GVGLLAAALLALNVMHIQLAHFFTSDPYLTFFVVTAVYFMVRSTDNGFPLENQALLPFSLFMAAVFVGLAIGSKFAAIMLLLPLLLVFWLRGGVRWWWGWGTAVFVAFLAFFLTNPFAVLDFSCQVLTPETQFGPFTIPALDWRSCYLENIVTQGAMVGGDIDLPFTRQYRDTLPLLYPIEMQLRWGMGLLLGVAAFAGFGWAIWQALRQQKIRHWRQSLDLQSLIANAPLWVTLTWTVPFFLTTAWFYVKFMRYLQPVTPFLLLYGAALLLSLPRVWLRRGAVAIVLLGTGLYAFGFVSLYHQPHPWVLASQWIYAHASPGTLILSEQWDDPLPTTMLFNGELHRATEYDNAELTWLTQAGAGDDVAKLQANLALLAEADYLVLTSNRVYGVVPRLPMLFPLSSQYHQLLFDGKLGYELVAVYGRFPHLGSFYLKPDTFSWPGLTPPTAVTTYLDSFPGVTLGRADESFIVYDQPLTMIWQNVEQMPVTEMANLFTQK